MRVSWVWGRTYKLWGHILSVDISFRACIRALIVWCDSELEAAVPRATASPTLIPFTSSSAPLRQNTVNSQISTGTVSRIFSQLPPRVLWSVIVLCDIQNRVTTEIASFLSLSGQPTWDIDSLLCHRLRRFPNIISTLGQNIVFTGIGYYANAISHIVFILFLITMLGFPTIGGAQPCCSEGRGP